MSPWGREWFTHLSSRFHGTEKNHSAGENTVGTHRALRNMDKAIEPRSVSFQFPGASSSISSNPPRTFFLPLPSRPPPSTTFQFILSYWLARFTTKFPLARLSSLCTLYLPLPLFSSSLSLSSRPLSSLDIWSSFLISSSFFRFNISPFTASNIYSGPCKIFA